VRGAVRRGEKKQSSFVCQLMQNIQKDKETKGIHTILKKSAASTRKQPTVFARCPKNFHVADMVTSNGLLLNMTINARHDINGPGLAKILKAADIRPKPERKLDLYFCLPTGRYDTFNPIWCKPKGLEWVKQHVNVYALHIPLESPPYP
jgi:hypothetical protein